ncbi:MAG: 6-carboxytetrahydropterin synthase [Gemmatimonadota bacterium]|nr:6-carboxytetrahydropterin synthase [Gemmatimonadota bacterium]
MPTSLTRVTGFRARHHLWMPAWSAEENRAAFGALSEPHPHDYRCSITVSGPMDPDSGMICDLAELDQILDEEIRLPFEGRHINLDHPAFATGRPIPTCEALARYLFGRVAHRLPDGVRLDRLQVAEDATLSAECTALD